MNSFSGKVALITGGSSGIGRAAALAFAREGAAVVIAEVAVERCGDTAEQIRALGNSVVCIETDVSKADQVQALVARAAASYGRLDYAFNNAGIEGLSASTGEYPEEAWNQVIGINLTGVWLCPEGASFITGEALLIDGGYVAQ